MSRHVTSARTHLDTWSNASSAFGPRQAHAGISCAQKSCAPTSPAITSAKGRSIAVRPANPSNIEVASSQERTTISSTHSTENYCRLATWIEFSQKLAEHCRKLQLLAPSNPHFEEANRTFLGRRTRPCSPVLYKDIPAPKLIRQQAPWARTHSTQHVARRNLRIPALHTRSGKSIPETVFTPERSLRSSATSPIALPLHDENKNKK